MTVDEQRCLTEMMRPEQSPLKTHGCKLVSYLSVNIWLKSQIPFLRLGNNGRRGVLSGLDLDTARKGCAHTGAGCCEFGAASGFDTIGFCTI